MTLFRFTVLVALAILFAVASADAIVEPKSGAEYPDRIVVTTPAGRATLVATGVGLREKTFLKADVYTIVSYVDDGAALGQARAAEILSLDAPKRLQMDMRRKVGRDLLVDTLTATIYANVGDRESIAADLATFFAYFQGDAQDGDRIVFDYVPGIGLTTSLNGEVRGVIANFAFVTALWSVWFGKHPEDAQLMRDLVSRVGR
jgi:hypothetical protein